MSREFKFHENLTRIMGTLREDQYTFMSISRLVFLRIRNVLATSCRENLKKYVTNFFFQNRDVYEIMWKSIVQRERTQMTIYHSACALHVGYLKLQEH